MFWFDDKANLENHRYRDWRQWGTFITYIYSVRRWKCKKKKEKKKVIEKENEKSLFPMGIKNWTIDVETMKKSIITNVSQGCVFFIIQGLYFITSFNIPSVHPSTFSGTFSPNIFFSYNLIFSRTLFSFLPQSKIINLENNFY